MTAWPRAGASVEERVLLAIEEVRPALRRDGGDIVLVRIDGDVVEVRLRGACRFCPMACTTLAEFIEERIKLYAPEIERVVAV
ncbi:MAG: NifU family protein [Acidobacteria bacterium]|nr:NifU family protein [Acidobacteriota bacterium]